MFAVSGAWGILCIGLFGGYFVSRYFEQNPKIEPELLISLLAVFGLGPTGLLLVQNYLQTQLLDPYGAGVFLGAVANLVLRILGITSRRYSIARALLAFSSTNPAVEPYVTKGGFEMPDGFALVALKQNRRVSTGEPEVPQPTLRDMKRDLDNPKPDPDPNKPRPAKPPNLAINDIKSIKRFHGAEVLSPFNVRINITAPDLKRAFEWIDGELHFLGYSHSEGYG